jgi:hypothetical protein
MLVVALLGLAGCASGPADGPDVVSPTWSGELPDPQPSADDEVLVTFDAGDGTGPSEWSVSCPEPRVGSSPEAEAACAHLRTLEDPFAPLPDDVACTEQYGGPQTAHVIGRWDGEEVDLELSRVDGCHISQWDSLVPLVPPVDGALPVD